MDLNSIPDEMLTNVLKYCNYLKCKQLRKLNTRMDLLAKRAGLSRMPVEVFVSLSATRTLCDRILIFVNTANLIEGQTGRHWINFAETYESEKKFRDVMTKWLTQLKIVSRFVINFNKLDNELFASLRKNKLAFRNTAILNLDFLDWDISIESSKVLINDVFPNLKTLNIDCHGDMGNILNAEVLGNRHWDYLNIGSKNDIGSLNDDFLLNVVAKTADFEVARVKTAFTVPGVIKLLKECATNSHFYGISCYKNLAKVQLGGIPINEVEHHLAATEILGIEIRLQYIGLSPIVYTVTLKQEKETVVKFLIDVPLE